MIQIDTAAPAKRENWLFGWICRKIKQHKIRKNREAIRRRIAERKALREEMKRAFWGL
jgi:hypothetical protein